MNRNPDHDRLLNDVLSQGTPEDFREAILNETLHLAGNRRRARRAWRVGGVVAVLALFAIAFWRIAPSRSAKVRPRETTYQLVSTAPLFDSRIVSTRPLTAGQMVVSIPSVIVISTTHVGFDIREINDDELLAIAPQPAALVRLGPHDVQLVIVRRDDHPELPLN